MSSNARFRWFLLAPIVLRFRWFLLAPIVLALLVVTSPVISWAGELADAQVPWNTMDY